MEDWQEAAAAPLTDRFTMNPMGKFRMKGFRAIRKATLHASEFWDFIVQLAKEANRGGKVLVVQEPVGAEELADLWDFDEDQAEWQKFLDAAVKADWLTLEGEVYRLTNPMLWYRPPSKMPESERERKKREREAKKDDCPQSSADLRRLPHEPILNRTDPDPEPEPILNRTEPKAEAPAGAGGVLEGEVIRAEGRDAASVADTVLSVAETFWAIGADTAKRDILKPVERGAKDHSPGIARAASREAIRELLWECHNGGEGKPREPAKLFARRFKQHLAAAAAHAKLNRDKAERRIAAIQLYPYRWEHPSEWVKPPQLANDFYLDKSPLAGSVQLVPAPEEVGTGPPARAEPSSPDPLSSVSLAKLAKAIE